MLMVYFDFPTDEGYFRGGFILVGADIEWRPEHFGVRVGRVYDERMQRVPFYFKVGFPLHADFPGVSGELDWVFQFGFGI